jgi:hypothetical protein
MFVFIHIKIISNKKFEGENFIIFLTILPKNENVTSTLSNLRQMVKTIIQNC